MSDFFRNDAVYDLTMNYNWDNIFRNIHSLRIAKVNIVKVYVIKQKVTFPHVVRNIFRIKKNVEHFFALNSTELKIKYYIYYI